MRSGKPTHYVGIDQLYTRDEVIALMKSDTTFGASNHREMDDIFREAARSVIAHFETHPADAVYITGLARPGEFIQLKDGEKVFQSNEFNLLVSVSPDSQNKYRFYKWKKCLGSLMYSEDVRF